MTEHPSCSWSTSNHAGLTARKLPRGARGRRGDTALTLLRMTVGLFMAAATPVLAHGGAAAHDLADPGHGLAAGFVHPFSGADHVLVPEDCVGDIEEQPHRDNLDDLGRRYVDVVDLATCLSFLEEWRKKNAH